MRLKNLAALLTLHFFFLQGQAQILTSVVPGQGMQGQTLSVGISGQGTHFGQGTSTTQVWLYQTSTWTYLNANTVTPVNALQVNAEFSIPFSIPTGFYTLWVYNSLDGTLSLPNAFQVQYNPNPPFLTSVNPTAGMQGQTLSVTVSGQNTHFGQGTSTTNIWFAQGSNVVIYSNNVNIISPTTASAQITIPFSVSPGFYDTKTYNYIDGELSLNNSFQVTANPNPPLITTLNPSSGTQYQNLSVTISGQNTHFGQGTSVTVAWFTQGTGTSVYPAATNVVNSTQLSVSVAFNYGTNPGYYDVHVFNSIDGDLIKPLGFYLFAGPQPVLSSVNPDTAVTGQTLDVFISGQNTHFTQGTGVSVTFRQGWSTIIYPNSTTILANDLVKANMTFGWNTPLGFYDVNLYNTVDGPLSLQAGFEVLTNPNAPVVNQVVPDSGNINLATNITIYGHNTHFISSGGSYVRLKWPSTGGTYNLLNVFIVNDSLITATVQPPGWWYVGWYDLVITNSIDGTITKPDAFYVGSQIIGIVETKAEFQVYPNPTEGVLYLSWKQQPPQRVTLSLYDYRGSRIEERTCEGEHWPVRMDYSQYPQGVYFLEIHYEGHSHGIKIILQH